MSKRSTRTVNGKLDLRRLADMDALGVEFHPAALVVTADLSFKQAEMLCAGLGGFHDASKWWIGDLMLHLDDTHPDRVGDLMEATGRAFHTLQNYRWVASKWADRGRRRPTVSHSAHAELATLPPVEQVEWLDRVEANGWRLEDLREHLRESRRKPDALDGEPPVVEPDPSRVVEIARHIAATVEPYGDGRYLVGGELVAQLKAQFEGE